MMHMTLDQILHSPVTDIIAPKFFYTAIGFMCGVAFSALVDVWRD